MVANIAGVANLAGGDHRALYPSSDQTATFYLINVHPGSEKHFLMFVPATVETMFIPHPFASRAVSRYAEGRAKGKHCSDAHLSACLCFDGMEDA